MGVSGNTPAYAGKTSPSKDGAGGLPETPPLTRGRPDEIALEASSFGNTPAYAGKTTTIRRSDPESWKHPRLRGEDSFTNGAGRMIVETPPLTRGRLGVVAAVTVHSGNTPAYAGKTAHAISLGVALWKHPRLRGEDLLSFAIVWDVLETPPLTRGRQSEPSEHGA